MRRTLGLQAWLALALVAAIVLPLLLGGCGWLIAQDVQSRHEHDRIAAATRAIAASPLDSQAAIDDLLAKLDSLDIAIDLGGIPVNGPDAAKQAKIAGAKTRDVTSQDYRQVGVFTGNAKAVLFVHRPGAAARWAAALGGGLAGLLIVVGLAFAALRRWVARPLAALAADADRIAGGDLDIGDPPRTRAREVEEVATAMRGMAGELGHALEASDAAERERRFVVTAIAHDLRTPLFTLRGSLQAIQRGIGNGEYVALAQRKADHLDHLVSDLFALSKLDYAAAADAVDLAALAREAAAQYDDDVTVSGSNAVVAGDAEGLLRVLTNLIDNAVRHADTRVHVDVRTEGDEVVVTVADDGPGIPLELLDRVFEPLVTADGARRGGAGLGLAIVERIVLAHGGAVGATNDGGAVVTVTLPRRRAAAA